MSKKQESILNIAFANHAKISPAFVKWLLSRTKFKDANALLVLARGDWPWYQSKTSGRQSETDILLVFQHHESSTRFALHIENKQLGDKFRPDQPELYHERAKDWLNVPKWGMYQDFEVLLIAPREFYFRNKAKADIFHHYISYDEISAFIPEFADSLT